MENSYTMGDLSLHSKIMDFDGWFQKDTETFHIRMEYKQEKKELKCSSKWFMNELPRMIRLMGVRKHDVTSYSLNAAILNIFWLNT